MEENKTTVTETKQEDKGLSQIQPNEKRSWWSIAFIWVGTMICIPMLMVGGIFGGVLTMGSIFWATLIGFAICCTMMILGGIVGSDKHRLCRFGEPDAPARRYLHRHWSVCIGCHLQRRLYPLL